MEPWFEWWMVNLGFLLFVRTQSTCYKVPYSLLPFGMYRRRGKFVDLFLIGWRATRRSRNKARGPRTFLDVCNLFNRSLGHKKYNFLQKYIMYITGPKAWAPDCGFSYSEWMNGYLWAMVIPITLYVDRATSPERESLRRKETNPARNSHCNLPSFPTADHGCTVTYK